MENFDQWVLNALRSVKAKSKPKTVRAVTEFLTPFLEAHIRQARLEAFREGYDAGQSALADAVTSSNRRTIMRPPFVPYDD
jgi:hypothetical protein